MNDKKLQLLGSAFTRTLGFLFLFILLGLFLDSRYMPSLPFEKQHLATAVMLFGFGILYFRSGERLRKQMLYAVLIGICGEYLLSVGLGMYTYRLGNVPHYVPPGHAVVLIATINFNKHGIVKQLRRQLELLLTAFIVIYSSLFLIFAADVFGFVMSMGVIYVLRNKPRERLFYLSMYLVVAFLEIVGTNYQCWSWPSTAWGVMPFLKSANPPSGISLFYFLLDLGCLWVYKQRHRKAWSRMKNIRQLRAAPVPVYLSR